MHCYIRFVYLTNRWQIVGGDRPRRLRADGRPFIGAFWHGRMMLIPLAWRRMAPMHMLISAHRDGRLIAGAMTYFGIETIAGSTRRGGSSAIRTMLKRLGEGECVAITPDGPRGPAMTASLGIVNLARLAGVPIQPVTYATSRRRVLATWDRYHLALPFGRGVVLWGEPIEIAADLDIAGLEAARRLIETRLNEMVREADRLVGHRVPPDWSVAQGERPGGKDRSNAVNAASQTLRQPPSQPSVASGGGEGRGREARARGQRGR
jgi:lysophospholipid acyltransferase (LPLAT)-like uncharacterized protein